MGESGRAGGIGVAGSGGDGGGEWRGWAVMVGAEGPGLSEAALAAADRRVRIPMAAGVDSLNVATAAAVALHRLSGSLAGAGGPGGVPGGGVRPA